MRIATLQFSPILGAVERNIAKANELIEEAGLGSDGRELDLLVGPELGFCGYNFPSLAAITPYLEPTASGPTAKWAVETAKKLQCVVCIGYAEREDARVKLPGAASGAPIDGASINGGLHSRFRNFNSQIVFSPKGALLAHYRKTHLYYTDESWALPSPQGFLHASIPFPQQATTIATFGICMDLNPRLFLAPWSTYEFATYALASRAELVICSMAWLTRLSAEELGLGGESNVMTDTHEDDSTHNKEIASQLGLRPDLDTLQYWLERLRPLIEADRDTTVVIANRSGIEPGNWVSPFPDQHTQQSTVYDSVSSFPKCARFSAGEPIEIDGANAPEGTEEARYAGTSCVLSLGRGEFRVVGFMGRAEEGLRIWDTDDS